MIARIVGWCARRPALVIAVALIAAGAGELARRALAHDALADLSEPQVALVVEWMGHPAPEVARDVTRVLTEELQGVAGATAVRGSSMTGMAYVDVSCGCAASRCPMSSPRCARRAAARSPSARSRRCRSARAAWTAPRPAPAMSRTS